MESDDKRDKPLTVGRLRELLKNAPDDKRVWYLERNGIGTELVGVNFDFFDDAVCLIDEKLVPGDQT